MVNVRKEAGLIHPDTGELMELDIYIPSLHLAFEYQVIINFSSMISNSYKKDIHHFRSSWYAHMPLAEYKKRDAIKADLAAKKGITLIPIPCWWDGKRER